MPTDGPAVKFLDEIQDKFGTLALLVHHQRSLIDTFVCFLKPENAIALEPILDLLVQLARDLREDFYAHFPQVFQVRCPICFSGGSWAAL